MLIEAAKRTEEAHKDEEKVVVVTALDEFRLPSDISEYKNRSISDTMSSLSPLATVTPAYIKEKREWVEKATRISNTLLVCIEDVINEFKEHFVTEKKNMTAPQIAKVLKDLTSSVSGLMERINSISVKTDKMDGKVNKYQQINIFSGMSEEELHHIVTIAKELKDLDTEELEN